MIESFVQKITVIKLEAYFVSGELRTSQPAIITNSKPEGVGLSRRKNVRKKYYIISGIMLFRANT